MVFFLVRSFSPQSSLALQAAERLRDDLRHIQMLAMTWNQPLRVTVVAAVGAVPARYEVSCVTAGATPPCNASPVIDPPTGRVYRVELPAGLNLAGPGFTLDLDALGRPKNGAANAALATFTISGGGPNRSVSVTPITAFVTAQ